MKSPSVTGPVPEQIEAVPTDLRTSPLAAVRSRKDGLGRSDRPAYSEFALQEVVVNALAHRDYAIVGSQVIVTLFPDRIEIRNPGGLHVWRADRRRAMIDAENAVPTGAGGDARGRR